MVREVPSFLLLFFLIFPLFSPVSADQIKQKNNPDEMSQQTGFALTLTLYQNGALFHHIGSFSFKQGYNLVSFNDVCPELIPGSIFVESKDARIISYSYKKKSLTVSRLLKAFLNKDVFVKPQGKCCAKGSFETVKLVAYQGDNALVMKDNKILQVDSSRIVFPYLPSGLKTPAKIGIRLDARKAGDSSLGLLYLSNKLRWKADYTGMLSRDERSINVESFALLKNDSTASIKNARLRLVAGDVNLYQRPNFPETRLYRAKALSIAERPKRQELFEYHLYDMPERVSLLPGQRKHVLLFDAEVFPCTKRLVLSSNRYVYYRSENRDMNRLHPTVLLEIETSKKEKKEPFPAGMFRVYKKDAGNQSIFVGEYQIPSVASGNKIVLALGKAFDITASRRQTAFKRLKNVGQNNYIYESSYEIRVHNSKSKVQQVLVREEIPGDWKVIDENVPHQKEDARHCSWLLEVPAESTKILRYSVKVMD